MGRDKRILVTDDDDAIRTLLFTVLRRRGSTLIDGVSADAADLAAHLVSHLTGHTTESMSAS